MEKFKNRKEVEEYFLSEMFKFTYMSDNMISFETLSPHFIDENFYDFELMFYYDNGKSFFDYSSFDSWLDAFQLSRLTLIPTDGSKRKALYFAQYQEK